MSARLAVLALLLLATPARGQEPIVPQAGQTTEVEADPQLYEQVKARLTDDPSARAALTERLLRSSLADEMTQGAADPASEIDRWILGHPGDAARLAIGFAQDEENHNHNFEISLHERVSRTMQLNPERHKGILGTLGEAGTQSKFIVKMDKKMEDEERRELLKRLFEGRGGESARVLTHEDGPGSGRAPDTPTPDVPGGFGVFDRLNEANPTGYSPQVLTWQSALNAQRPPGAPRLNENGRLDFQTLSYPAFGLRYNIGRLETTWRSQKAWELAHALGRDREFSPEALAKPETLAKLEDAAKGKALSPRWARRRTRLDRASHALADFQAAAEPMRDPRRIDRAALKALGDKQREASRWLTAASLEEDLQRLEAEQGFWTAELERLVREAPIEEALRMAYLKRAEDAKRKLGALIQADTDALAAMESLDFVSRWPASERRLAQLKPMRPQLFRDIRVLTRAPYAVHSALKPLPRWRVWVNDLVVRMAPGSPYGKSVRAQRDLRSRAVEAFVKAAAGDFAAAEKALAPAS